jgi:hypothetical protein
MGAAVRTNRRNSIQNSVTHIMDSGSCETSRQRPKTLCRPYYGGGGSYETSKHHPKLYGDSGSCKMSRQRPKTICRPDYGSSGSYETSKQRPKTICHLDYGAAVRTKRRNSIENVALIMGPAVRTKRLNSVPNLFVALIMGQGFVRNVEIASRNYSYETSK